MRSEVGTVCVSQAANGGGGIDGESLAVTMLSERRGVHSRKRADGKRQLSVTHGGAGRPTLNRPMLVGIRA